jgi:hypothetical protein
MKKEPKIVSQMRRTPFGWKSSDISKAYLKLGCEERMGSNHAIYLHNGLPWGTLTRSSGEVDPAYVKRVIELADHLKRLEEEGLQDRQ